MDIEDYNECENLIKLLKQKSPTEIKKYLKYLEQRCLNDNGSPKMDEIFEKVVNEDPKLLHYSNYVDEEEEEDSDEDYQPSSEEESSEDELEEETEEEPKYEVKQFDDKDKRYIEIKLSL